MLFFRSGGRFGGSGEGGSRTAAVPWNDTWSPIAYRIWLLLVCAPRKAAVIEFATELLLPFTIPSIRASSDLWATVAKQAPSKYTLSESAHFTNLLFAGLLLFVEI